MASTSMGKFYVTDFLINPHCENMYIFISLFLFSRDAYDDASMKHETLINCR